MEATTQTRIVSGASARRAASIFHYGNLAAALIPGFAILWFGMSMLVFAVNSHHPDPRVLAFNRRAARNYYPVMAVVLLVIAAGFGGLAEALELPQLLEAVGLDFLGRLGLDPDFASLLFAMWFVLFIVLVPLSIRALIDIHRTDWHDVVVKPDEE